MIDQKTKHSSLSSSKNIKVASKVFVHPEATNAYFSNYFAVEQSEDDVTISFGQRLPTSNSEEAIYEIRKRVVMTHKGLKVLTNLLSKLVEEEEKVNK